MLSGIKSSWEEIANIIRNHFQDLVGTEKEASKEALRSVLQAQTTQILEEAKQSMEKKSL